jgi:hypothetical protein
MGRNHDFLILASKDHPIENWNQWHHNSNAIQIHDDILHYMADTLKWIPTCNPAAKHPYKGLCWYGPTVIQEAGAQLAAKILGLWADLYTCGPAVLRLTGGFSWQLENDPVKDGFDCVVPGSDRYEELVLNRDRIVANLRMLVSYAERVQQTAGAYYILHMGI